MYYQHFELSGPPFRFTPSTSVLYLGKGHRECLAALEWALLHENCGFMLLIGETGVGKTTLLCTILSRQLNDVRLACVTNPRLSFEEMMRVLLKQLGSTISFGNRLELLDEFERVISEQRAGQRTAVIIDEAQDLSDDTLEDLRLLANCADSQLTGLQFVLMGQPELLDRLGAPNLRQIRERISAKATLLALTPPESIEYVECRLAATGGKSGRIFQPDALSRLVEASAGIPRRLNVLCHNAMLVAYSEGEKKVNLQIADEVIKDFESIYLNKLAGPVVSAAAISKPIEQPAPSMKVVAASAVEPKAAPARPVEAPKPIEPKISVQPSPVQATPIQPTIAAKPIETSTTSAHSASPMLLEDPISRHTIPLRPAMMQAAQSNGENQLKAEIKQAEIKQAEVKQVESPQPQTMVAPTEPPRAEVHSSESRAAAPQPSPVWKPNRARHFARSAMLFVALFILGVGVVLISDQNAVGRILTRSVGLLNAATLRDQRPASPETAAPLHQEAVTQPNATATTGHIEEIKSTAAAASPATATAQPLSKTDARREIQVGAGDTMHDLAARYLGSVDRTHDLIALNPQIKNPDVLYPGETVYLPSHLDKAEQE